MAIRTNQYPVAARSTQVSAASRRRIGGLESIAFALAFSFTAALVLGVLH